MADSNERDADAYERAHVAAAEFERRRQMAGMRVTEEVLRGFLEKTGVNTALDRLGYVLVPKEPTEAMLDAGLQTMAAWQDIPGSQMTVNREKMRRRYMAMIEASQAEQKAPHREKHPDEAGEKE